MSSLILSRQGSGVALRYRGVELGLDTAFGNAPTLLSHSHADHISDLPKAKRVIATSGTIDTLKARGGSLHCEFISLEFEETFVTNGVEVTLLNAGHVLGSSMFLIQFRDGLRVLYTGDFNTEDSIVHNGAKPRIADVLITEATYGSPRWVFPERGMIHKQILLRAREVIERNNTPIFNAYSLGKAQEAIALLQNEDYKVISGNSTIDKVNDVYNRYGAGLQNLRHDDSDLLEMIGSGCAIVSSNPLGTIRTIEKSFFGGTSNWKENSATIINLSGWTLGDVGRGGLPLSAHSGFNSLLEFASKVNPRVAYVFTGNAHEFAGHLSKTGINAVPLE